MTAQLATDASHLYRVVDTVRGKFYIGKHGGREQKGYWGSGLRIKRHIKKHGLQDMKYEILVVADEKYILDLERKYVTDEFIVANPDCLNLCSGGVGGNLGNVPWNKGINANPEHMAKLHEMRRGKPSPRLGVKLTQETIAKISAGKTGKKHSEQSKKNMSSSKIGLKQKMVECPHCLKVGGKQTMGRWHFNNCKHKEQHNG